MSNDSIENGVMEKETIHIGGQEQGYILWGLFVWVHKGVHIFWCDTLVIWFFSGWFYGSFMFVAEM